MSKFCAPEPGRPPPPPGPRPRTGHLGGPAHGRCIRGVQTLNELSELRHLDEFSGVFSASSLFFVEGETKEVGDLRGVQGCDGRLPGGFVWSWLRGLGLIIGDYRGFVEVLFGGRNDVSTRSFPCLWALGHQEVIECDVLKHAIHVSWS